MSGRLLDVAVVGAGPAGLAVAIESARRGLRVAVFERRGDPVDKACGEGVMPPGVRALSALGVRSRLLAHECAEFGGIRYIDVDGTTAEGTLPASGLAVRRVALTRAMAERARELGADLRFDCAFRAHRMQGEAVVLDTEEGPAQARMLVAADGLCSPLRRAENLEAPIGSARRFGLRQHFRCVPWTSSIEIHLALGAEAYVTPVSTDCIGVAFLWSEAAGNTGTSPHPSRWASLERLFPQLGARLQGAVPCSRLRGAGPLARASRRRTSHRFALVGDAAGYVDAITGEGISLSLLSSMALARILPDALARGASRAALAPYERDFRRLFRRYALATRGVLAIVRRPRLRLAVLRLFRRFPASFDWLLARVIDV